jgi:O-succinylbenzoic acid--CoA ligase
MNYPDFLPDWLSRCALQYPNRIALRIGTKQLTFVELHLAIDRYAYQLARIGIHEESRVALMAHNGLYFVLVVHALTRLGAILIPLNLRLSIAEISWQIDDIEATHLLYDASHRDPAIEIKNTFPNMTCALVENDNLSGETAVDLLPEKKVELRSQIDLGMTQAIIYTSGTTGHPKGAIITYGMQWWNAIGSALNLGLQAEDHWLACLPLFHIGGLSILWRSAIYGISVTLYERFDAEEIDHELQSGSITIISVVAVMVQRLLAVRDAHNPKSGYPAAVRCMLLGGGPIPATLIEDCVQRQLPIVQTYGMTESCSQAVTVSPKDIVRKPGSAGFPLAPVQMEIRKEDGILAEIGIEGEIWLRGPTITPGYAGKQNHHNSHLKDRWFATGDIGYIDSDGYLYVLDRRADLIISGGENIYPAEIESVLLTHPSIAEAGVRGGQDEQWGQVPIAFVRLKENAQATPGELIAFASQHLANYKVPRQIFLVESLPRNATGKLLRRLL